MPCRRATVPPRCAPSATWPATHSSSASASPVGRAPVRTVCARFPVLGSSRTIVRSASFATQTASALVAIAPGLAPTGTVARTWFDSGSIRDTVPSSVFATQTAPAPNATALGPLPTPIVCVTSFVFGIEANDSVSAVSPIQTAPSLTAMPRPEAPTSIVSSRDPNGMDPRDRLVVDVGDPDGALAERYRRRVVADLDRLHDDLVGLRSMRDTVPPSVFATQTSPPPTAIPLGPSPTRIVCRSSCDSGSMRYTLFYRRARDPDRVRARGDARRRRNVGHIGDD